MEFGGGGEDEIAGGVERVRDRGEGDSQNFLLISSDKFKIV